MLRLDNLKNQVNIQHYPHMKVEIILFNRGGIFKDYCYQPLYLWDTLQLFKILLIYL
jgi:hypothetical protein